MYDLLNGSIVTRDQFAIEPMNDAKVDAVQIPNNWDPEVGWVLNFS